MSSSDRLDEIEARIVRAREGRHTDRHMVLDVDAPALVDALRAVLDVCDRVLAVTVAGSSEGDAAMAAFAAVAQHAIEAALGEGHSNA